MGSGRSFGDDLSTSGRGIHGHSIASEEAEHQRLVCAGAMLYVFQMDAMSSIRFAESRIKLAIVMNIIKAY